MAEKNDWRLTNQMQYLHKKQLLHIPYEIYRPGWEHEHCEFCFETIENSEQIVYCTTDKYHWICDDCFKDFHKMFGWVVVDKEDG